MQHMLRVIVAVTIPMPIHVVTTVAAMLAVAATVAVIAVIAAFVAVAAGAAGAVIAMIAMVTVLMAFTLIAVITTTATMMAKATKPTAMMPPAACVRSHSRRSGVPSAQAGRAPEHVDGSTWICRGSPPNQGAPAPP